MEKIPIIDCSILNNNREKNINPENLKNFAEQFGAALSGIGFAYLSNHGLDLSAVDRVYELSKQYFELPAEIKTKYRKPPGAASFHGYAGPGDESLNENQPSSEFREFFDVSGQIESNDPAYFPTEVPGFKEAFDAARSECAKLAEKLLRAIAIYLGLEEEEFVKRHTNIFDNTLPSHTVMRSSYYSPLPKNINTEGGIRCGEHSDWLTITLLFQDSVGGLEVRGTSGEWIPATPIKDAIVINSGQLLEIYSGGRLAATPHRVRILEEERLLSKPRQSFVYAPSPDASEDVEPLVPLLEELCGKVKSIYGPQSYEKVNSYEFIHNKHSSAANY